MDNDVTIWHQLMLQLTDWKHLLGFVGLALFGFSFILQWYLSEREKRLVIPKAFWICRLAGCALTLAYGILIREYPIVLAQFPSGFIYCRNLALQQRGISS